MLACVCSLGIGLVAWLPSSARSEAGEPPTSSSAKVAAEPESRRIDRDPCRKEHWRDWAPYAYATRGDRYMPSLMAYLTQDEVLTAMRSR
jgi:hypothetical protein